SGTGGTFSDDLSETSTFFGTAGNSYELLWTVSNTCGSNEDTVVVSFYLCSPSPSPADAGNDILNATASTVIINASPPAEGTGLWTINSGAGGSFMDALSASTSFYGQSNETYELQWTVSNACGSNSDFITVSFSCFPVPSPANAGVDQLDVPLDSVILAATAPIQGTGEWSIANGAGGIFSDSTISSSTFFGTQGVSYELVWIVSNTCGSNTDTVEISFIDPCLLPLVDVRDGKQYSTVKIGNQCWMAENLNYGTIVLIDTGQTNSVGAEKYCYNDSIEYCNTYGGIYIWNELMEYSTQEAVQGLCPAGWHVPTDNEWYILENFIDTTVNDPNSTGYRGTDVGTKLKLNGSSGMNLLLGGHNYFDTFVGMGEYSYFATSTQSTGGDTWNKWIRMVSLQETRVLRNTSHETNGAFLRCIKD
ncbi:MAG: FISUMP domain-containing protein, partial [Bacteroidota bacterium]|nr:FISUMP domain-containing protein [Bacteroidota bacterium]